MYSAVHERMGSRRMRGSRPPRRPPRQTSHTRTKQVAMRVCSVHGCPEVYPRDEGTRCARHRAIADRARGTAHQRGYTSKGHQNFRREVLHRDPVCVICHLRLSTIADHYPHSRRELIELAMNPDDPTRGRGLCKPCHDRHTATEQPGGWHTP